MILWEPEGSGDETAPASVGTVIQVKSWETNLAYESKPLVKDCC